MFRAKPAEHIQGLNGDAEGGAMSRAPAGRPAIAPPG